MSISLAAGPWATNPNSVDVLTLAVSPTAIGDLMTFAFDAGPNSTATQSSSVSGGGVSSWALAKYGPNPGSAGPVEIWWGVVTSTGSSTITITNSTVGATDNTRIWAVQWNSSVPGIWLTAGTPGSLTGSGTAFNYAAQTGSGLYFGAANNDFGTFSAGATSGFTYTVTDGHLMTVYNTAASGTSQPAGVTNDAGSSIITVAALFTATPPGQGPPVSMRLPSLAVIVPASSGWRGAGHSR